MAFSDYLNKKPIDTTQPVKAQQPEAAGASIKEDNPVQASQVEEKQAPQNIIPQRPLSVYDRVNQGQDAMEALLDNNYKETEAALKRKKAADYFGNLAALATNAFAVGKGSTQTRFPKSNVSEIDDQMLKYRNAYNNQRANLSLSRAMQDYKNAQWQAEQDRKDRDMNTKNQQWRDTFDQKQGEIDNKKVHDDKVLGLAGERAKEVARHDKAQEGESTRHNKTSEGIAAANAKANITRANHSAAKDNEIKESIVSGDGTVHTRNNRLTPAEARSIYNSYNTGADKETIDPLQPDYVKAATNIIGKGKVPEEVLRTMGFNSNKKQTSAFNKNNYKRGGQSKPTATHKPRLD